MSTSEFYDDYGTSVSPLKKSYAQVARERKSMRERKGKSITNETIGTLESHPEEDQDLEWTEVSSVASCAWPGTDSVFSDLDSVTYSENMLNDILAASKEVVTASLDEELASTSQGQARTQNPSVSEDDVLPEDGMDSRVSHAIAGAIKHSGRSSAYKKDGPLHLREGKEDRPAKKHARKKKK